MSRATTTPRAGRAPGRDDTDHVDGTGSTNDPEETLSLLSDEYARRILRALAEEPLSATELADRLEISRATVYRRLDRLTATELVRSTMRLREDGHHRHRFHVAADRIAFRFGEDGVSVEIRP